MAYLQKKKEYLYSHCKRMAYVKSSGHIWRWQNLKRNNNSVLEAYPLFDSTKALQLCKKMQYSKSASS